MDYFSTNYRNDLTSAYDTNNKVQYSEETNMLGLKMEEYIHNKLSREILIKDESNNRKIIKPIA